MAEKFDDIVTEAFDAYSRGGLDTGGVETATKEDIELPAITAPDDQGDEGVVDRSPGPSESPESPQPHGFNFSWVPGEEITVDDCADVLGQGYDQRGIPFDGDRAKAAACLKSLSDGVRYVNDKFAEKGVVVEEPSIGIIYDGKGPEGQPFAALTDSRIRQIYLSGKMLEGYSTTDIDAPTTFEAHGEPGAVFYEASPKDAYFLIGVEEGHHDAYNQLRGPEPTTPRSLTLTEYSADEREWQALRWQAMAARELGMPQETQDVLRSRVEAVKLYRRQLRNQALL